MNNSRATHITELYLYRSIATLLFMAILCQQVWAEGRSVLSKESLEQGGMEYLQNTLQWDQDRMEIEVVYQGKPYFTHRGKISVHYKLPGNKKRVGRVPFMALVKVDGILKKRIRLHANVQVAYDIFKTVRTLKRGHLLQPADVKVVTLQSDKIMRNLISDESELIGHALVRNLEGGETLLNHMVRRVPLVKSGDRIMIIVQRGSLRVTAPGVVRENGFKNDIVKVENVQSRKIVFGTVVNSRTIRINF